MQKRREIGVRAGVHELYHVVSEGFCITDEHQLRIGVTRGEQALFVELLLAGTPRGEGRRMIYFTSDTHFGHAKAIEFAERPWETAEQMNTGLLANISARVGLRDDLYILGDFSFRITASAAAEIRRGIRCQKEHLVPGNHDKDWTAKDVAGTFIVEPPICKLKVDGHKFVLSHYPLEDWESMSRGSVHLHGHIHSRGSDYNEFNCMQGIYRMDVGVDANGHEPVSLDEVLARFEGVKCRGWADWRRWAVSTDEAQAQAFARELIESEG